MNFFLAVGCALLQNRRDVSKRPQFNPPVSPKMAKPRRIVALNLGSQTIGHAEFRVQPQGGLVLHAYGSREALIDPANPSLDEAELASLRELVAELQTQRCEVNYAIAPQSVFARFVKLPAIEEEKIQRIVAFEAQQNVPFPIDEVVWDYQVIGGGGNEEMQVVLVAIKADLLDEINRAVEETKDRWRTREIEAPPTDVSLRWGNAEEELGKHRGERV